MIRSLYDPLSEEKSVQLFRDFGDYINGKKDIPEKFLSVDPLRKFAKNDSTPEMYELYKKGPKDIKSREINT